MRIASAMTCRTAVLAVVVGTGLLGCNRGSGMPKTYAVKGKVMFKSGQTLSRVNVLFESTAGDPPWRASAYVEPDGKFSSVTTLRPEGAEARGLVEGEHRIRIDLGRGGEGGEDRPRTRVPARYLGFEKSGLTVRVPAPNDDVTIVLEDR
jgi:hypothetical protein